MRKRNKILGRLFPGQPNLLVAHVAKFSVLAIQFASILHELLTTYIARRFKNRTRTGIL